MGTQDTMQVSSVLLTDIFTDDTFNCRGTIAPIDVVDLAKNIESQGLIQPVVVKVIDSRTHKYLLVAGYRRFTAFKILKRESIPCIIRDDLDEAQARILNLNENLSRKDLNIMQEARAISRLKQLGITEETAAKALNVSRGWVQVRYMLLALPKEIQDEAISGTIRSTDIRTLYSMPNVEQQFEHTKKLKEAVTKGYKLMEARALITQKKKTDKKARNKPEVLQMMDLIQTVIGNGLFTRTMAWTIGEITDYELFGSIKGYCDEKGINFSIPNDGEY